MRLVVIALLAVACGGASPPASPPSNTTDERQAWQLPADCTETGRADGAFLTAGTRITAVLVSCVTNMIEHDGGGTETEMEATLVLLDGGVEVRRDFVTSWSDGWEWGADWTLVGTRPGPGGRDAIVLEGEGYSEDSNGTEIRVVGFDDAGDLVDLPGDG